MKADQVMIGDWLFNDTTNILSIQVDADDLYLGKVIYYRPIPLTTEILEKNGFLKSYDDDGIHFKYTLISDGTSFSLKYIRNVFQWLGALDFKYVHELQHALKLADVNIEIKL